MHAGAYPVASSGLVLRFCEIRKPLSRQRVRAEPGDGDRAELVMRFLRRNGEWRERSARVAALQVRLRRQVSDEAWRTYLDLEEVDVARWHGALLLAIQWASRSRRPRRRRR